jgi:tetratricopeptide (TPR) repeat protein
MQGGTAVGLGRFDLVRPLLDEAFMLAREAGDSYRIALILNFRGDLARLEQNYSQAKIDYGSSIALFRELNAVRDLASALHNLGHTYLHLGDVERAHTLFSESMAAHQAQQNTPGIAECLIGFAAIAIVRGWHAAGVLRANWW